MKNRRREYCFMGKDWNECGSILNIPNEINATGDYGN